MENEQLKKFLDEQNEKIKELSVKGSRIYFGAITTGDEKLYAEYEKIALELEKFFNDKENFERIKVFLESAEDELEKRQLKLIYEMYAGSQGDIELSKKILEVSTKIDKKFNVFRAEVDGKKLTDNEIKEILKTETDSAKLKVAWEASKKQGANVEEDILELILLRNKLARSLGYENYFQMSLELNEQTEAEIDAIFKELNGQTEKPFDEMKKEMDEILAKRYEISEEDLKPWHYQDLFFQEGPEIYDLDFDKFYTEDVLEKAIKFYDKIGFDVQRILEKSDLYEKEGKYQHACCFDVDRAGDVRIVQSTKNNEYWMNTTLHELGHGVYDSVFDETFPFLLRGHAHTFVTEAIALLFGRLSKNSNFIRDYSLISESGLGEISKSARKQLKIRELVFSRWCQVMYNFEKEIYKNPKIDFNELWWSLVKKYQKINFSRDAPDWAAKIHIASSPVYYHNYMLGELLASQLQNYIVKKILNQEEIANPNYDSDEVGKYLKENLFVHGKRYKWDKLIENATDEKLTAKYFIQEFCD